MASRIAVIQIFKTDPTDPKALMRLYGTRRVPGLYVPYEKTEPRVTKTYSERMKELQMIWWLSIHLFCS